MPKSKNPLLALTSGTIGKQVVVRQRNGEIILAAYPEFKNKERTANQKVINKRMIDADEYAKDIMGDPLKRDLAQVRLNVKRNRLYTSLISEYFKKFKQATEEPQPTSPAFPTALAACTLFVTYLLKNTAQTPEEIAELVKVPVDFVVSVKNAE